MFTHDLLTVQLTRMDCDNCGGVFSIVEQFRAEKQRAGGWWYCPYCGSHWHYITNQVEELKKEKARLQSKLERKEAYARDLRQEKEALRKSRAAVQGHLTRQKNRIKHGVCPCCNRTFKDLGRHMKGQHPGYGKKQKKGE